MTTSHAFIAPLPVSSGGTSFHRAATSNSPRYLLPHPLRISQALQRGTSRHHTARRAPARAQSDDMQEIPLDSTRIPEAEALDPSSGAVIIRPDFKLAAFFLFTGGALTYAGGGYSVPGFPFCLLGALLAVQSTRIRFVFGPSRLSVALRKGSDLKIIRGWEYSKIANWEVWWPPLPCLAYFKERESYNGRGGVHFFPILCDGSQLVEQLLARTPHIDKPEYK